MMRMLLNRASSDQSLFKRSNPSISERMRGEEKRKKGKNGKKTTTVEWAIMEEWCEDIGLCVESTMEESVIERPLSEKIKIGAES